MKLKQFLMVAFCVLAVSAGAQDMIPYASPQDSVEYRREIDKMMVISGSTEALDVMIPQIKLMLQDRMVEGDSRRTAINIVDEIFDGFAEDMMDIFIPIYRKYFTVDDIRALNKFYESPVGQKFATNMPGISVDSMQAGQRYAQKKIEEAVKKLEEKQLLREI